MRTYYDSQPDTIGYYQTPDGTTVRFRENIREEPAGEMGTTQFSADEYTVHLRCNESLARRRIEANTEAWLAKAKEAPDPEPTEHERIAQLESENNMLIECILEMSEIIYQ